MTGTILKVNPNISELRVLKQHDYYPRQYLRLSVFNHDLSETGFLPITGYKAVVYSIEPLRKKFSQSMKEVLVLVSRYTGCPRRNVPDFGRVFLRSNYTDINQNTYVQS